MQDLYDHNTDYQTSLTKPEYHPIPGLDMSNRANFKKYMGGNERYVDYLRFFEAEIQKRGAHAVAQEYLFSGNAGVYNMGNRIYAGEFLLPRPGQCQLTVQRQTLSIRPSISAVPLNSTTPPSSRKPSPAQPYTKNGPATSSTRRAPSPPRRPKPPARPYSR